MILLLENFNIQRNEEPWMIFQRYLVNGLYFPSESYKTQSYYETILISTGSAEFQHFSGYNTSENVYNLSKMIIKQIISVEDWGIFTMKERQICLNKLYKEWVKVPPDLNALYHTDHICYIEKIEQVYFFVEFFIPWIHKWTPEVGFTKEQIPCLHRTFYNNF
ncbi:hypothetical protein H5410_041519 [Solanum commersonii]|uniref:Uncharacterized protein n=1 Tax=Solanum commersonii TaxID=4109 RepID=A0A9J5XT62_SOLCO|nr:hypothetical protein H5410_041519 [Solanum commersonii]